MDNSVLDNRPLVTQPKRVDSSQNLEPDVKLAFINKTTSENAVTEEKQQDPSLRWATAADTVDEVLGEMDLPVF